ncbi:protein asteroid homolog 1-like [Parambassis ranga]|uniref:Protein asteroid homolog 1-like n=1 Tax=Parambassis ranga TaxID=210632 RepID=A0A6P7JV54_9TELE|nr:protein asteroid homolog 1-like [Parambassis ranga]
MGVQGLSGLIENQRDIHRDVRFRTSRLLIDGSNLSHLLYYSSGLDQNHGGEYAAFEDLVERFVSALRSCRIAPYVLMDGGSDFTDRKLETVTSRAEDRIKRAHQAAESGRQKNILPGLIKWVFRQTLVRLEVPVAQCFGEADQEIAALAKEWKCPVLSNDSDFFIFNLPAGILPISHFRWKAVRQSGSRSYIPCKRYQSTSFCSFFRIRLQLLPVFAVLAGNDYVKQQQINWTQFAPAGTKAPRLEGLLCWLRGFQQPQKALKAAVRLLGNLSKTSKAEVRRSLDLGLKEYQVPPSCLQKFFTHGEAPEFPVVEELCPGLRGVAELVPDWMRLPLTQARLIGDVLDVLLLHRVSLSIAVEHKDLPSSNLTSGPLRQVMYGLLLSGGRRPQVEERDRDGLQPKFTPVTPTYSQDPEQLNLSCLHEADPSQRLQVLLEALGVTQDHLRDLPPQLQLPVAVTCYWLQRAQPAPGERLVEALLLGMSRGDAPRSRTAVGCSRQKPDVCDAHAFNQWQACLKDTLHLNQLLGFPLPEPHIAR